MAYVVKSTGPTGNICWLTIARANGIRTIGPRSFADTFPTEVDARIAIAWMPQAFTTYGILFTVESSESAAYKTNRPIAGTPMPFVVKVTGTGFSIMWLAPDPATGSYTFGPRKNAIIFPTLADAKDAVVKASESFGQLGMRFSVEFAD